LLSKNIKIKIYRTVVLPVVLCECETWSLILREERGVRVFENRVLRRAFGLKKDKVRGEWRKLHNVELNDLYCSPKIFRVIKLWGGDRRVQGFGGKTIRKETTGETQGQMGG
jgi:hypothetical protein